MTSPGGRTIARVSIRVVPDVKGFRDDIEEELRKIGDRKVTIEVDWDVDPEELRAKLAKIRDKVVVPVTFDVKQGQLAMKQALSKAAIKVPAKVDIDAKTALGDIDWAAAIEESRKAAIGKPVPAALKLEIDWKAILEDGRRVMAGLPPLNVPAMLSDPKGGGGNDSFLLAPFRRMRQEAESALAAIKSRFQATGRTLGNSLRLPQLNGQFRLLRSTGGLVAGFIGQSFVQAGRRVSGAFGGISRLGRTAFGGLAISLGTLGIAVGKTIGSVASLGAAFVEVGSDVLGLIGRVARVLAIGALIGAAGATITAAWGAASTAIAAVPAAIGLIGAPIAAVLLGMDGIKKAAKTIEPAFKDMRKAISDTFEKGLTPVFKNLATNLFPTLKAGFVDIADSLTGLADRTGKFLTETRQLDNLKTTFKNIGSALDEINLNPLLDGFIRLSGNQAALSALTTTINELGTAIQAIADNPLLNEAFAGLEGVLKSLTVAFGELVNNGIELFAGAAPGLQASLDGITGFFSKFDYKRLGKAIGDAFQGIGEALNSIPPGTIESITQSFESLGRTIKSGDFQSGIRGLADLIAPAVDALNLLAKTISFVGNAFNGIRGISHQAAIAIGVVTDATGKTSGAADRARADYARFRQEVGLPVEVTGINQVTEAVDRVPGAVHNAVSALPTLPPAFQQAGEGATNSFVGALRPVVPQTKGILSGLPQVGATEATRFSEAFITPIQGLNNSLQAALVNMPTTARQNLAPVPGTVDDVLSTLPSIGTKAGTGVNAAIGQGFREISGTALDALQPVQGAVDQGLAPLAATSVPQATQDMVNALNTTLPGFGTALQTGLSQMGPLVDQAFLGLSTTNIAAGVTAMGTALTAAFTTTLGPAVTTGFTTLSTFFTTGFTTLGATLPTLMAPLGLGLTTAFTTILGPAVTQGFVGLGLFFTTGFITLGATLPTLMAPLAIGLTTAFTTILGPAVTQGFVSLNTAFTTGFQQIATTAVGPAMQQIATTVQTGFAQVVAAVQQGMIQALAATQQGTLAITTEFGNAGGFWLKSVQLSMTAINTAVQTGMTQVNATLKTELGKAVQTVESYKGQFQAAGRALMEGMAQGIVDGSQAVADAARQAVEKAVAAAKSAGEVKSPSKLFNREVGQFLTLGQAEGQIAAIPAVEAAARQSVLAAMRAAQNAVDTLGVLQVRADFAAATSTLAAQLSTELTASRVPLINFEHTTVLDGKVVAQKFETLAGEWAKDVLVGARTA